jgi:hypothetical protein
MNFCNLLLYYFTGRGDATGVFGETLADCFVPGGDCLLLSDDVHLDEVTCFGGTLLLYGVGCSSAAGVLKVFKSDISTLFC